MTSSEQPFSTPVESAPTAEAAATPPAGDIDAATQYLQAFVEKHRIPGPKPKPEAPAPTPEPLPAEPGKAPNESSNEEVPPNPGGADSPDDPEDDYEDEEPGFSRPAPDTSFPVDPDPRPFPFPKFNRVADPNAETGEIDFDNFDGDTAQIPPVPPAPKSAPAAPTPEPAPAPTPLPRAGMQARFLTAVQRALNKQNEAGDIVPRKGVRRSLAVGGAAVMGTLLALRYGPEIGHSISYFFGGGAPVGGGGHAAAVHEAVTQTTTAAPATTPAHGVPTTTHSAAPTTTTEMPTSTTHAPETTTATTTTNQAPTTGRSSGAQAPSRAPQSTAGGGNTSKPKTPYIDGQNPHAGDANAPAASETVTIGAHHQNSVWGELHAEHPSWTNTQIASAIDNTEHATGHNLNHVFGGQHITIEAPTQTPNAAPTQAHAALHAPNLHHNGNVEPIAQPQGASVTPLQPGVGHNSVSSVLTQTLAANHMSVTTKQYEPLLKQILNYNGLQNVDTRQMPVGWPVYMPPQAVLQHMLDEINKQ